MPIVPANKEAVVTVKAGGEFTVMVMAWVADMPAASATLKVTELPFPAPVGVPEITPVLLLRLNPAGSVPEVMLHVHGSVPPASLNVAL